MVAAMMSANVFTEKGWHGKSTRSSKSGDATLQLAIASTQAKPQVTAKAPQVGPLLMLATFRF